MFFFSPSPWNPYMNFVLFVYEGVHNECFSYKSCKAEVKPCMKWVLLYSDWKLPESCALNMHLAQRMRKRDSVPLCAELFMLSKLTNFSSVVGGNWTRINSVTRSRFSLRESIRSHGVDSVTGKLSWDDHWDTFFLELISFLRFILLKTHTRQADGEANAVEGKS